MRAPLKYYSKWRDDRYVVELTIHELSQNVKYPEGIKYGLICKDLKTGHYVLLDNHHPKGPHLHIGSVELPYEFLDEDKLIEDFKKIVFEEMGLKL
ncbi:hypothetical protein D3C87_190550 [compost metagenome]